MKIIIVSIFMVLSLAFNLSADDVEQIVKLKTKTGTLEGTLLVPTENVNIPVALIIGSTAFRVGNHYNSL